MRCTGVFCKEPFLRGSKFQAWPRSGLPPPGILGYVRNLVPAAPTRTVRLSLGTAQRGCRIPSVRNSPASGQGFWQARGPGQPPELRLHQLCGCRRETRLCCPRGHFHGKNVKVRLCFHVAGLLSAVQIKGAVSRVGKAGAKAKYPVSPECRVCPSAWPALQGPICSLALRSDFALE